MGTVADTSAPTAAQVEVVDDHLLKYLKNVEGSVPSPDKQFLTPYISRENDKTFTMGYGHKLAKGDGGEDLTEEQATELLRRDVTVAANDARSQMNLRFGEGTFEGLPVRHAQALVDMRFNLGPRFLQGNNVGFPKFATALVEGDLKTAVKEHERWYTDHATGRKHKLERRNRIFKRAFLGK